MHDVGVASEGITSIPNFSGSLAEACGRTVYTHNILRTRNKQRKQEMQFSVG